MVAERRKRMITGTVVHALSKMLFGPSISESMRFGYERINFKKLRKCRKRINGIKTATEKNASHLLASTQLRPSNISPVTAPLALISQIQRSGGSFLSQLFDGHPQLYAHPHELKIGYPFKWYWPHIDLADRPEHWFFLLFEDIVLEHMKSGYRKDKKERHDEQTHAFAFSPALQKEIFLSYVQAAQPLRLRDVFDGYMTSYFNAWLDNRALEGDTKKYVTAFTPRMAMWQENMDQFAEIYPDGKLISIVRDPKNWFPSALRHKPKTYEDVETAMQLWKKSVEATIANKERFGEQICIIKFEDLVAKPEPVMRYLSQFLDISFDPILLTPTFNGSPIGANTSFGSEKKPIVKSTLYRYTTLSKEETDFIDQTTADVYRAVLQKVVTFSTFITHNIA